jgi:hypothetical protein
MGILRSIIRSIRSILMSPEAEAGMVNPVYRYGILVLILAVFAWEIKLRLTIPPAYRGNLYDNYAVVLMLLFMHLSFAFKWPKSVARALWILALSWFAFFFFYIVFCFFHTIFLS